jgi:hypothetical protein
VGQNLEGKDDIIAQAAGNMDAVAAL